MGRMRCAREIAGDEVRVVGSDESLAVQGTAHGVITRAGTAVFQAARGCRLTHFGMPDARCSAEAMA